MKTQETTTTTTTTTTAKKPAKAKATKGAGKPATKEAAAKAAKVPKTTRTQSKATKDGARTGSKTAINLDLLRQKEGASIAEIGKAINWQNQSIGGFLSAQVTQKMGLKVESEKVDGERRYRVPA